MHCPKCQSPEKVKAGFTKGKQRYKCKSCSCHYTRSTPKGYPPEQRELALKLYLEGLGFRAIGRILGISYMTPLEWIRQAGRALPDWPMDNPKKPVVRMLELDELWHYVGKKRTNAGCGLLLIACESKYLAPNSAVVVWQQETNLSARLSSVTI